VFAEPEPDEGGSAARPHEGAQLLEQFWFGLRRLGGYRWSHGADSAAFDPKLKPD
jgi:hypothetical protein